MEFDKWLNETEIAGLRIERLYADIDMIMSKSNWTLADQVRVNQMIMGWLRVAYDEGHDYALGKMLDDGK